MYTHEHACTLQEAIMAGTALGYIRVSTSEQAKDGVSLEVQKEQLESYAKLYDIELVDIVADEGASGKSLRRDGLETVLDRMEQGETDAILVYKLDRLTRSVADLGALIEKYFKDKYRLLSVQDQIDTASANGRFVLNLLGSVSQWEREVISERTTAALQHKKELKVVYNHNPLGYTDEGGQLIEIDEEMLIVTEILNMRNTGLSYRSIANDLNERGIVGKRGGKYFASTIRNVCENTLYDDLKEAA